LAQAARRPLSLVLRFAHKLTAQEIDYLKHRSSRKADIGRRHLRFMTSLWRER
jgi:hypothetical protein